jgi:hypothetical protein
MKLIAEKKFEAFYNGETKIWKIKFKGNQHVSAEFVEIAKERFQLFRPASPPPHS